ncbi:MaoC family dehydratase [Sodalis glossinidius]|uniref:MaoC family dehydratase n=1 Tax=Sodalis glossinidius TaxID=63612 RepID=UPI0002F3AF71|nr:hotdog domain-containing protein [Sodalis glossinidius]
MQETSSIGTRIAHGALIISYISTASTVSIAHIIHRDDITEFPVTLGYDGIHFLKPILLGDTVTVTYTVESIDEAKRRSIADVKVINKHGDLVVVAKHIMKWSGKLSSRA